MDRKQIHKIGRIMNKPVKFVKKNAGIIVSVVVPAVVTAFLGSKNKK